MTTKTIGTSSRNYATMALWESYLNAQGVLTVPEIGEAYNDSEFSENVTFTGITTSSSNTVTLRPASGQGFRDNTANALRYDQSQGVAWTVTGRPAAGFWACDIQIDYMTVFGMQIRNQSVYNVAALGIGRFATGSGAHDVIDSCIISGQGANGTANKAISLCGGKAINCLIYTNQATERLADDPSFSAGNFYGCTFARTSNQASSGYAVYDAGYGLAGEIKNCAIFGVSTAWGAPTTFSGGQTYCATDLGSFPAAVTGGVTSLTYTSQFASTTNTATDFKSLSSGGLKAGTPDSTNTPVDIFGTTRDATTPYIGCYEVAAAPGGGVFTPYFYRFIANGMSGASS